MSEMEHKQAKLVKVLDGYHMPINIQLWLESQCGVCIEERLSQEEAYSALQDHFLKQDWDCNYYLFNDELYEIESERTLDEYGYVEAELVHGGLKVDAFWYNGGGSFSACITDSLKKLENEVC